MEKAGEEGTDQDAIQTLSLSSSITTFPPFLGNRYEGLGTQGGLKL